MKRIVLLAQLSRTNQLFKRSAQHVSVSKRLRQSVRLHHRHRGSRASADHRQDAGGSEGEMDEGEASGSEKVKRTQQGR
jgi:hypothetical protein